MSEKKEGKNKDTPEVVLSEQDFFETLTGDEEPKAVIPRLIREIVKASAKDDERLEALFWQVVKYAGMAQAWGEEQDDKIKTIKKKR